ncbi:MAG: hypothetical protein IIU80_03545 [Clostridia bacterium]|nr:hypothetical protein [Clostridia bacterium]
MIIASFAKQYGIRLLQEDISVSEYLKLLGGLMADTPLGEVVQIRAETDRERIANMTVTEKRIRSDWQAFKAQKMLKETRPTMSVNQLQKILSSLAGR